MFATTMHPDWSPSGRSDNATMAQLLIAFTASGAFANDGNGPRGQLVTGLLPGQAQVVTT